MNAGKYDAEYDLIEEVLDERRKYGDHEQETDEALPIREAETHALIGAYIHVAAIRTQLYEELEFRHGREECVESLEQLDRIAAIVGE